MAPLVGSRSFSTKTEFTTLSEDDSPFERITEVEQKRQGYVYGPSLPGNTSYFPTGLPGDAMVQQHIDQWLNDASWINTAVGEDANIAMFTLHNVGLY